MSIEVEQIILHQLVRKDTPEGNNGEQEVIKLKIDVKVRPEVLAISAAVENMMLSLHQNFQNKAKAYATFQQESKFAQVFNKFLNKEEEFVPFSQYSAEKVAEELAKYPFAESGTFIMAQYRFLATKYLFIALLDSRTSMLVDDGLNIQSTSYLNINQFDIAASINITELESNANSNRYLTFIKGRVGRKIADFFMDFLEAEEGLDARQQSQTLVQAVSDYCQQGDMDADSQQGVRKQLFDYCKEQIKNGEEVVIEELSETLPNLNNQTFSEFSQQHEYGLEESIPPVASALKGLAKFSGAGKGVSVSFDAELLNQRIFWDEQGDTLTIKGLPANLRDQIQRRLKEIEQ